MQHFLERLDIVPRDRYFQFIETGHGEEEGTVILGLDFMDFGKVDDETFVGAEEAERGEGLFCFPEGHEGTDDAFSGVKEGGIRFFRGNEEDIFLW